MNKIRTRISQAVQTLRKNHPCVTGDRVEQSRNEPVIIEFLGPLTSDYLYLRLFTSNFVAGVRSSIGFEQISIERRFAYSSISSLDQWRCRGG